MNTSRKSYDTNVKHFVRMGLLSSMPLDLQKQVPSSNINRWRYESPEKYVGCELSDFVNKDLNLYKRIGETHNYKKFTESYFKLCDAFTDHTEL